MKFYVPMGYQPVFHQGNKPEDQLHTFHVTASSEGYSRSFIVMAKDEDTAKANFLTNIVALGEELKKTLKPEDLEPTKVMAYDEKKLARADEYLKGIHIMEEKLLALEDNTDTFAEDMKQNLRETIAENYEAIRKLKQMQEKTLPSRFERMMERVSKLPALTITATRLNPNRCYACAYFDDPRDYTSTGN